MGQNKAGNESGRESGNPVQGALSGLKVLEIGSNIAVEYCCKLLGDMGAEVVKVEDPATAVLDRQEGSICSDEKEGEEPGCSFAYMNTNKLGTTLSLETEAGRSVLDDLVRDADILVEGNSPRRAGDLGLEYERLKQVNDMLVVTSITPFGKTGPYREYKAYTINISSGGLCLYLYRQLAARQKVEINSNILPFFCETARVCWIKETADGNYTAGFEFCQPSE